MASDQQLHPHLTYPMVADARMLPDFDQMKAFVQEAFEDLRPRVLVDVECVWVPEMRARLRD